MTTIATALVRDSSFALRTAVAADSRIQAQYITPRRAMEKAFICKYPREMSEKRKDKLVLNEAALREFESIHIIGGQRSH